MEVSFISGGNRSTRRKPSTCRQSLTNFITWCCNEYTFPLAVFELTTLMAIGTDCTCSCKSSYQRSLTTTTVPNRFDFGVHKNGKEIFWDLHFCWKSHDVGIIGYLITEVAQVPKYFFSIFCVLRNLFGSVMVKFPDSIKYIRLNACCWTPSKLHHGKNKLFVLIRWCTFS